MPTMASGGICISRSMEVRAASRPVCSVPKCRKATVPPAGTVTFTHCSSSRPKRLVEFRMNWADDANRFALVPSNKSATAGKVLGSKNGSPSVSSSITSQWSRAAGLDMSSVLSPLEVLMILGSRTNKNPFCILLM